MTGIMFFLHPSPNESNAVLTFKVPTIVRSFSFVRLEAGDSPKLTLIRLIYR